MIMRKILTSKELYLYAFFLYVLATKFCCTSYDLTAKGLLLEVKLWQVISCSGKKLQVIKAKDVFVICKLIRVGRKIASCHLLYKYNRANAASHKNPYSPLSP